MADKTIGDLPVATELFDDSRLVVEQQSVAMSLEGKYVKEYLEKHAKPYVDNASDSASDAKESADSAKEFAKDAAGVSLHPPKIQDGNWWTWDTEKNDYEDSGMDAGVSLTVGTVTTGEPGTNAKVTNRGTPTDPILDFTLPRGAVGATGPQGPVGPAGPTGPQGPVGPAGGLPGKFSLTLPARGWVGGAQTVTDARILDGHDYVVDVAGAYIPADGITIEAGKMTVRADIVPVTDVTVTVLRIETVEVSA